MAAPKSKAKSISKQVKLRSKLNNPKVYLPFIIVLLIFGIAGAYTIKSSYAASWETAACISGKYRMESSLYQGGKTSSGNRAYGPLSIFANLANGELSPAFRIDYTVLVQYRKSSTSSWQTYRQYGPTTSAAGWGVEVTDNVANPPYYGSGNSRVVITSGVDGDGVAGCKMYIY